MATASVLALTCGLVACSGDDDESRALATSLPAVGGTTRVWETSGTTAADGAAEQPDADVEVGEGVTGLVFQFDCTGRGSVSVSLDGAAGGGGNGECPTTDGSPARVFFEGEVAPGTHRASVRTSGEVDWIASIETQAR
ncbi:MAG: hypothetical protein Q7T56_14730 [Nocardioidaceae bacterium]|nr:hypothetical protein [Nocardioidaceae bacterium]